MKIIMINGSPRKNGATAKVLARMRDRLILNDKVEVEIVNVSDLDLVYCNGCSSCYKKGYCYLKDDLEDLSQKMSEADALVLASPVYVSNVSAQMKNVIDRGHFVIEQLLHGKYGFALITYENAGASRAMSVLKGLLLFSGARISGTMAIKNPLNHNPLDDEKILKKIDDKADRFYSDIFAKRKYFFQSLKHYVIFNVGIKPFVLKKKEQYQGLIENHWEKRGLI